VPHRLIRSWYTCSWWVGCYIWYSDDGPGSSAASLLYSGLADDELINVQLSFSASYLIQPPTNGL